MPDELQPEERRAAGSKYNTDLAARTEAAFLRRVKRQGGTPARGAVYAGSRSPFPLICGKGHARSPRPGDVMSGRGICRPCALQAIADQKKAIAEVAFLAVVERLGGTPAPGATYVNIRTPYPLICEKGHDRNPRPGGVLGGRGICRPCADQATADQKKAIAEAAFLAVVEPRSTEISALTRPSEV